MTTQMHKFDKKLINKTKACSISSCTKYDNQFAIITKLSTIKTYKRTYSQHVLPRQIHKYYVIQGYHKGLPDLASF